MRYILVISLFLLASSCSSISDKDVAFTCPTLKFLKGYDVLEVKDKEVTVSINSIRAECEPDDDRVVLDLVVPFSAKGKKPSENMKIDYFVSLLSEDNKIVSKKVFDTNIELDEMAQAIVEEEHKIEVPVKPLTDAYKYKIIAGFVKDNSNDK